MQRNAHRNWCFDLKKSSHVIVRMPDFHSLLFFNHIVQFMRILIQKKSFQLHCCTILMSGRELRHRVYSHNWCSVM